MREKKSKNWEYTEKTDGIPASKRFVPKDKNGVLNGIEEIYMYVPAHEGLRLKKTFSPSDIQSQGSFAKISGDNVETVQISGSWYMSKAIPWKNGKKQGNMIAYDSEGYIREVIPYDNDKKEGRSRYFDAKHNLIRTVPFHQGVKNGWEFMYDKIDGRNKPSERILWKEDKMVCKVDYINHTKEYYNDEKIVKRVIWGDWYAIAQYKYNEQNPYEKPSVLRIERDKNLVLKRCVLQDQKNEKVYYGTYDAKGYLISEEQADKQTDETIKKDYTHPNHLVVHKSKLPIWIKPQIKFRSI